MNGLRITRRGWAVITMLVALLGGLVGWVTATYAWDGEGYRPILACESDDGSGPRPCYWDASEMGDGHGVDFWVDTLGQVHTGF